jgi:hypothetical protein
MRRDFSKIAFHSKLFKGHSNWYFCYLKTEKLAQALAILVGRSVSDSAEALKGSASFAVQIVQDVVYTAAGEVQEETLLADLLSMISTLRLHGSRGYISRETARILVEEYEMLVERLVGESKHLGLSVTEADLAVPAVTEEPLFPPLPSPLAVPGSLGSIKDTPKGHSKNRTLKDISTSKGQERAFQILNIVKSSNGISIKDIAKVVRGCSEKTIQRELNSLIERGIIVREGERRWSTYRSA